MSDMSQPRRLIALDTETTGLNPQDGDRIVEIGCVELINLLPSGETYQTYINPQRPLSDATREITGLTDAFLADKPLFADIAEAFFAFIGDSPLVMHNADFDTGFLNAECARLERAPLAPGRIIDSLALARAKFPGKPNSLDALCRRFAIDASAREKHGALLDAGLLAEVYLELVGGRQRGLALLDVDAAPDASAHALPWPALPKRPQDLPAALTPAIQAQHLRFLQDSITQALWLKATKNN